MEQTLSKREEQVLFAIIKLYTQHPEPVGSRYLCKKFGFNLSPATIRNTMSDLEDKGYLKHPHTSAGRIPTEEGYRYFVNDLLKNLTVHPPKFIRKKDIEMFLEIKERDTLLSEISSLLSHLSKYIGIVIAPKHSELIFKHIKFIQLNNNNILGIFVSKSGMVFNTIINEKEHISQQQLDKMAHLSNKLFEGKSIQDIKNNFNSNLNDTTLKNNELLNNDLFKKAYLLTNKAFSIKKDRNIYIDGRGNILNEPSVTTNFEEIKSIIDTFDNKTRLLKLIDDCLKYDNSPQVLIGIENEDIKIKHMSMVLSSYNMGDHVKGLLGVVGPMRMYYGRAISTVEYIATIMNYIFMDEI
ncbi:MAG: heat-inducible transcriptional repressor HrcA [bacterium]